MKPTYSRPIIWICSLIMTALGFAGCSDDEDTIVADEYGTPYADYKYMGTVTDENGEVAVEDMTSEVAEEEPKDIDMIPIQDEEESGEGSEE